MKEHLFLYAILFSMAVLTVHFISWIGSVLHSVPNAMNGGYAVFTFRSDQDKPMSTNLLMNILFPNVILILFHLFCYQIEIPYQGEQLFAYVPFYYLYRMLLICIILRRKELYSIGYELTNAVVGIGIAYWLTNSFLKTPDKLFIEVSELVNEFWLIILLLIYKFAVLLLDKLFNQKTVVGERCLVRYIRKQFDRFYKRFKALTDITEEDKVVWILLYSIMIFENYNRGSFLRTLERIKLLFGKSATVGIMQVKSEHDLSDEESIIEAYNLLRFEIMKDDLESDDDMQIEGHAFQYNPDENYSKSVSFIYSHLRAYIEKVPKYRREFHLDSQPVNRQQEAADQNSPQSTIYDLMQMTGLDRETIFEIMKQENMTVLLPDEEVDEIIDKYRKQD